MDIGLARTFLEIVSTGSFGAASERLHLTQTAVSARVRALENQLGRRLFVRNKAGARLTPAGERFVRPATALVQIWERARQQIALPPGRASVVSIGSELSLWNPLLADWLAWMRRERPAIALRAEVDVAGRLMDHVQDGSLDLAVLYSPQPRPGLAVELLAEEKLVMVTTAPDARLRAEDYIHVDWGSAFNASLQAAFPALASPAVSISLGPLALGHMLSVGGAGYFRQGAVAGHLDAGRLWRVRDAPEFSYSVHAVYSARSEADLIDQVRVGLRACIGGEGPAGA
jgi:DNA-binding transcriptional LysR family regulator